jgi:hypothetical protein
MLNQIISTLMNQLTKDAFFGINSMTIVLYLISFFNKELLSMNKKSEKNIDINKLYENLIAFKKEPNIQNIFDFTIDENLDKILFKLLSTVSSNQDNLKLSTNYVNQIFEIYLNNENLSVIKDYVKFYNHKKLVKWIITSSNINLDKDIILDANVKVNSFIDNILEISKNVSNIKNRLFGVQPDDRMRKIILLDLLLKSKHNFKDNITDDDILFKDINLSNKYFDVIFFDLPTGLHNITHASCCQKIKKLKIRGTKSESLFLQLVMSSLNKNGKAIMIVPDSLLFSDAVQSVETRKYLLENFNVKKIVQIDEFFYLTKGNKNSIVFFENNGKTKNIEITNLYLDNNNEVSENKIMDLSIEIIKNNQWSLYYKNYQIDNQVNNEVQYGNFNELFNIIGTKNEAKSNMIIGLSKYYKNNESISIITNSEVAESSYDIFITSKTDSKFMIYFLHNLLLQKYETYTKGKMNQFDINKISTIKIPILSDKTQQAVCNYVDFSNKLIQNNNEKIGYFNKMKECVLQTVNSKDYVSLNEICQIYQPDNQTDYIIGVIKNGLTAGSVYKILSENLSNNSHYLKVTDNKFMFDYVYHILCYYQNKLKELANLTPQPNLTKTNLLNFKIPNIDIKIQMDIVEYCNEFDNQIKNYQKDNDVILYKDFMTTVNKLNNL